MLIPAIFLLSFSSLCLEVLLARSFAISQWNHLSFMVISIALFGFAASGALLSIFQGEKKEKKETVSDDYISVVTILYSASATIAFLTLNHLPLDYFRLPVELSQSLYLSIAALLLALPFFFTGWTASIAFSFFPEKTGKIYFSSMAGSALGALLPGLSLSLLGEGKLIIITAIIPLALLFMGKQKRRLPIYALAFLTATGGLGLIFWDEGKLVEAIPSPYKALSLISRFPNTTITKTVSGLRGRTDFVQSPHVRFAPGLSLKFSGTLPGQHPIFRDGDEQFILYDQPLEKNSFPQFTLSFVGYRLLNNPDKALLLERGGGFAIACAISSRVKKIVVLEQNPVLARAIGKHYNVEARCVNPRSFLSKTGEKFSVIHVENWGASLPGASVLSQNYLFTLEAFKAYLRFLTDDGILIISRKLILPPTDSLRLFATAYEALREGYADEPERHLALIRNWDTVTLLVSPKAIKPEALVGACRNLNFDPVYYPGIIESAANKYNIFDEPFHFREMQELLKAYQRGDEDQFFKNYFLDIKPQSDKKPFPGRFLKWSRLKEIYKARGGRIYAMFLSGEISSALVFGQALLLSIILLGGTYLVILRKGGQPPFRQIVYFLSVGAGFMFVEIFFIRAMTFLFGDPIISFTVVLTGVLIFSGIGGYVSGEFGKRVLPRALIFLILVLTACYFSLGGIFQKVVGLSTPLRFITAFLILLPPSLLMGLPFTLGMRHLLQNRVQRAFAWGANGCASVLGAIASPLIALGADIFAIMAWGIIAYVMALLCFKK